VLSDLLAQIPPDQAIGTVTADGAYDTRTCHTASAGRGGTAVIPIRKNGRPWKEDGPAAQARNETLRATRPFGRALWTRLTGYHARSRIEIVLTHMTRAPALSVGTERDDIADLHLVFGDHDAVDQQFDKLSALGEVGFSQPTSHPLAELGR